MPKIRKSGGYRDLRSFQITTVIYDATYRFCERFLDHRSRMSDQMVQAARSGRQNIAEGSRASASSSQTELRLVNVARSSLEELLLDFEDFLRHRGLRQWGPDSTEALEVRDVGRTHRSDLADPSDLQHAPTRLADERHYALYAQWLDSDEPSIRANALICLIHQANYLLDQQIEALEKCFIQEGGYSEQLATARLAERKRLRSHQSDRFEPSNQSDPIPPCPKCGKPMALRTARRGTSAGRQFWGCTDYPDCTGLVEI